MSVIRTQSWLADTQKVRIMQKVKGGNPSKHYDLGTIFLVDTPKRVVDVSELVAFTPLDPEFATAQNLQVVGVVTAIDGVDATANEKVVLSAEVVIDIDLYNKIKVEISNTTMALPFNATSPQVINGFGKIQLIRRTV